MKRISFCLTVLLGAGSALLTASCGGEEKPPENILAAKGAINTIIKEFHKAYNEGDLEKISALLAPDCHFKKDYQSFAEGKDACLELLRKQIEDLSNQNLLEGRKTTYGDQTVRINGKVASVHYYVVVTDKHGSHKGIITAIFRYQDATWLLWQYHDDYLSD